MNKTVIKIGSTFALSLLFLTVSAQNADKTIRKANKLYQDQKYTEAETKYDEALDIDPNSEKSIFNQGNAYYKQERFDEALQNFEMTAEMLDDPNQRAAAYHNLGNAYFQGEDYQKSIEAYKSSLRLNPKDDDTRYNLVLAQNKLKQQQQEQQQNQDQNQENQDQENQDQQNENQDQQNQDQQQDGSDENQQQNQDQQNQDQQQQNQQGDQKEQEGSQQQAAQPVKLSKEEVQRILEALANDENKVQEKLIKKKTPPNQKKADKDW